MKKLILFLLFVFLLCLFNSAKLKCASQIELPNLYIEEGIGSDTYLEENELTIISGIVNWNKEGTYKITYKDEFNNRYIKNCFVLPKKDNSYTITKSNENLIDVNSNNIVVDIFYITKDSFYVISNYQLPDPTAPDQEQISVMYYEKYEFKWEYRYYKYSRYVSGCLQDDNIVITGLVYNENNYYINSIVLFEVTRDRQIIKSREITSNKSCFIHDIFIDNNYIYLVTNTSGNKTDYEKFKYDDIDRLVIFKISYDTFQIIDALVNESLENFIIVDASYYDRRLTVNVTLREKNEIYTNCIYEYNDNLEYVNEYYFSVYNKDYLGHQVTASEICFFSIDHSVNDKCVKIEYLHMGVENKNILLDLQNTHYINDVDVVYIDGNNIYFSMNNRTNKDNNFLGYCRVNSINLVTYFQTTPENIDLLQTKNNNNILFSFYKKDKQIYTRINNITEIRTIKYENNYLKEKTKRVYSNFIELNKYKYEVSFNKLTFGIYKDVYYYIDDFYNEYYLEDETEIKFICNINDNEIYQQGYKLDFNGEGLLNGNSISSGYIINDIGKYQLVIKGNQEVKIISFSIDDLTIDPIYKNTITSPIKVVDVNINSYNCENYIDNKFEFKSKDTSKEIIPLSLIILCAGIVCFFFVRKKI